MRHSLQNVCADAIELGTNGSCLAAIAAGSLLFNTLAVKIGKRPIYLATTLGLAVCCFWAAEVRSFGSLIGARAVLGFCIGELHSEHSRMSPSRSQCSAPFEALTPASVADIWHVHERGLRMAIFNLGVLGGIVSCNSTLVARQFTNNALEFGCSNW